MPDNGKPHNPQDVPEDKPEDAQEGTPGDPESALPDSGTRGSNGLITPSKMDRLERQAIRQRWPIPDRFRKPMIDRQVAISIDPKISPRDATQAFKAVLAADGQNLEEEKIAAGLLGMPIEPITIIEVIRPAQIALNGSVNGTTNGTCGDP